jgi:hypothetical protein
MTSSSTSSISSHGIPSSKVYNQENCYSAPPKTSTINAAKAATEY